MRYRLSLRFDTPFSVGVGNESLFHTNTQRVIPGATLRGALAALWWRRFEDAEAFAALFDDDLLVTQAVPDGARLRTTSTVTCKYGAEPRCGEEAVYDRALFVASGEELGTAVCPYCGGPLTAKPGWSDLPHPVRRGRVALEANETAKDGELYSRDYIGRGTSYTAEIETGADPSWLDGAIVRVGQGRSQDRGRAVATVTTLPKDEVEWRDGPVAIHLTSPAIITNEWGAPSLDLHDVEGELRRVSGENAALERHPEWVRSELVTGWHGRSNLPKVPDWAFAPGVSFVVDGLTVDGWRRLRRCGIGWRRVDGYGQVALTGWEPANKPPVEITAEWWEQEGAELRKHKRWSSVKGALFVSCVNLADTSEVSDEKTQRNLNQVLEKAPAQLHEKLQEILHLEPRQLGQLAELLRPGKNKKRRK